MRQGDINLNNNHETEEENPIAYPSTLPTMWRITKEAWPFVFNRAIEVGVDFGTMVMLSRINPGAASLSASMYVIVRSVNVTFLYYTAQSVRENKENPQKIGSILRDSWRFAFLLSMAGMTIAFLSEPLLKNLGQPETPVRLAKNFLVAYGPGLIPTLLVISNQQMLLGLGKPKTVLFMTALHTPFVSILGYLLTFTLGLQETGLGIAYSVVALTQFSSYLLLFQKKFKEYRILGNLRSLFTGEGQCRFLAGKGFWIGIYAFLELSNVWSNTMLIGHTEESETALSALSPALQYASFLANSTFALGHSIGILVKGSHTERRHSDAKWFGHVGIGMSFALPILLLILFLIDQDLLLKPFLGNKTTSLARSCLLINIIGQIFDALRNSASGALRGLGNTAFATQVNAATVFLFMLPFSLIAQFGLNEGPKTILAIRTIGIAAGSLAISYKWRKESNDLPEDGFDVLPGEEQPKPRGCFQRFRNYFGCQKTNETQIQNRPENHCILL